jgi:outer membrane protein X
MKKLMMIAAMVLMSTGAFAQEAGKMAVGATFTDLLDSDSRIAIGGKFQYGITENLRAEADFKLFPKKYNVSVWNPTLNVHYLFPIFDKFYVYGLGGLGLWGYSWDIDGHSDSSSIFTFKFGAGAEYYITDQIKGLVETYYQIAKKDGFNYTDPLISIGAAYCF